MSTHNIGFGSEFKMLQLLFIVIWICVVGQSIIESNRLSLRAMDRKHRLYKLCTEITVNMRNQSTCWISKC